MGTRTFSGDLGAGANLRTALTTAGNDIFKCTAIDPVYGVSGAAAVHVTSSPVNAQCNGTATAFDAPRNFRAG